RITASSAGRAAPASASARSGATCNVNPMHPSFLIRIPPVAPHPPPFLSNPLPIPSYLHLSLARNARKPRVSVPLWQQSRSNARRLGRTREGRKSGCPLGGGSGPRDEAKMAARFLLALDQGTSSSRAALVNAEGELVAVASEPLACHYPADGWVEQDPEA